MSRMLSFSSGWTLLWKPPRADHRDGLSGSSPGCRKRDARGVLGVSEFVPCSGECGRCQAGRSGLHEFAAARTDISVGPGWLKHDDDGHLRVLVNLGTTLRGNGNLVARGLSITCTAEVSFAPSLLRRGNKMNTRIRWHAPSVTAVGLAMLSGLGGRGNRTATKHRSRKASLPRRAGNRSSMVKIYLVGLPAILMPGSCGSYATKFDLIQRTPVALFPSATGAQLIP